MAYLALLEEEGLNAQYLCVLSPARRVSSFTLSSGAVYYNDFSYGYVSGVRVNGVALATGTSSTLSAGEFYWDHEASRLYIRKSDSLAPSGSDWIIVTYEIHVGTFDAHWYRMPTDSATTVVYFDPVVSEVPEIRSAVSDQLYGLMPTLSTSIGLVNAEHVFEKHIYDSSFNDKEIRVYHWLGDLDVANMKLVFQGRMGNVSYSGSKTSIQIFDTNSIFNKEYRSTGDVKFFNLTDFPRLAPDYTGKPIRTVYGMVDGFVPVNIDYKRDEPTTSDNRDWIIRADGSNSHQVTKTVPASPVSTTTRTYLNSVSGLVVGDSVWFDKSSDEYRHITVVGANYIEHAALSVAATTGDTVKRGTVGSFDIVSGDVKYRAQYNRDYTESVDTSGALKVTLSSSLESNLSMPNTLTSYDRVFCRVYGKKNDVTLDGSAYGSDSTAYGNLTNAAAVLLDILKDAQGLPESELDVDSFSDLIADVTDEVGFSIPEKASDNYPKIKDVLLRLFKTSLLKLFHDFDSKWRVVQVGPLTTTIKDIAEDEILRGSIDYSFDFSDVFSDFVVKFKSEENSETGSENYSLARTSSSVATYLHGQSKTYETESLHIDLSGAQVLADRLSFILGDRQGIYSLATKNRFYENVVADGVSVTTEKLPGFEFVESTERARDFEIVQIDKSLRRVRIKLNDNKGIQDNILSW